MPNFQQPFLGLGLNLSLPVFRGLIGAWQLNQPGTHVEDLSLKRRHMAKYIPSGYSMEGSPHGLVWSSIDASNHNGHAGVAGWDLNNFTIEVYAMFRASRDSNAVVLGRQNHIYCHINTSNQLGLAINGVRWTWSASTGASTLNNYQWYHMVFRYDGATVKVYVDGVEDGSDNASGIPSTNTDAWLFSGYTGSLGSTGVNNDWNGQIAYGRMWDRALTPGEIKWLANNPDQVYADSMFTLAPPSGTVTVFDGLCSDGLKFSEAYSSNGIYNVSAVDGIHGGDTDISLWDAVASLVDGSKYGDTITPGLLLSVITSDGVKFAEALSYLSEIGGKSIDGLKVGDTVSLLATVLQAIEESALFGDTGIGQAVTSSSIEEGTVHGDTAAGTIESLLTGLVSDGVDLGDTISNTASLLATAVDGVQFSEVILTAISYLASVIDGLKLSDVTINVEAAISDVIITVTSKKADVAFGYMKPSITFSVRKK